MRNYSARWPLSVGFAAVIVMLGALGAWSIGTRIAGAVVAPGTVEVESDRQVVQHPDGGVVGEILVRDGDSVTAGDVLIRLDGTFLRSELAVVEGQLAEIHARRARLEAERDNAAAFVVPEAPEFLLIKEDAVTTQIEGQKNLFEARRAAVAQEKRQIAEQQAQIERQIEGTTAQLDAQRRQLELISEEIENIQNLSDRGLVQRPRLLELQREEARLLGEIGNLQSSIAEAQTRISALAIESLQLDSRRSEEAISRLRDIGYTRIELEERRISLTERIARLDVRAPVSGVVFDSRIAALQSVVQAAEPMMFLIPGDQPLQVSVRIDPIDVDQVYSGQNAALMFTTFNRRTVPEIPGTVIRVSADAETDEISGLPYYQAVLIPDAEALDALPEDLELRPGMPVEAFLKTDERTPLDYLTQPLTVYFQRAFREE